MSDQIPPPPPYSTPPEQPRAPYAPPYTAAPYSAPQKPRRSGWFWASIFLGILLVIYAVVSLRKFVFTVSRRDEKWVGGIVGLVTGVISAATGVQVIPSMPYFQAIGMEKDELIQALGVFFTIATLVQAFNLSAAGLLNESTALPGVVALACSFTGMAIGQAVRTRLEPDAFRHWFLISMILLGIYLAGAATYEIYFT